MTNNRTLACLADADVAIADVRDVVGAGRKLGIKTVAMLPRIAAHCNVAPRRIRTLFHRDQTFLVTPIERRALALSIADLFDRIADECEAYADRCREKGIAIRARERDQLNSLGGDNPWSASGKLPRRHAA